MLLRLGHPGRIEGIDVDTAHFKGNFPHQISVNAAFVRDAADDDLRSQSLYWPTLLEAQHLAADKVLQFREQLTNLGPVSHLRVNLHPDGGLSRLRVFGKPHIEAA
jgi:allantoicase